MKVNLKECSAHIYESSEGKLTQEQADELVAAFENIAKNNRGSQSTEDAINVAAREMSDEAKKVGLIVKRNSLLTFQAMQRIVKNAKTYANPFDGIMSMLEDSRKKITGANLGANAVIEGHKAKYMGELKSRLMRAGLLEDFMKDRLEREIFMEFHEPGSSGSAKAAEIRNIMVSLKQDAIERQNLYGSFINFRNDHVVKQSYSPALVKKQFGPDRFKDRFNFNSNLTPDEYVQTFQKWAEFVKPLLNHADTFTDSDPDKFLRGVFDGIMSGVHGAVQKASGAEINTKYTKTGALARRISQQRIMHYADGEAAYAAHKAFSPSPLSGAFIAELEHAGTNIGLMQMFGPNPSNAIEEVVANLEFEYSRSGEEEKLRSLQNNKHRIFSALSYLDRSGLIPENPTMASATASTISLLAQAKLGKILLFALPDRAMIQSVLTHNGMQGMDALSAALRITTPSNPEERLRLVAMGAELKSFIGAVNGRFMTGAEGTVPSALHRSQQMFFKMSGIHWLDDVGTDAVVGALSRHAGVMADRSWDGLLPEFRNVLDRFGVTPKEWDAWRSTAFWVNEDGRVAASGVDRWITPDRFKQIPDDIISEILVSEDRKVNETNIKKKKIELETKFRAWLTAQRDEGVLTPGSKEHRLATFGTKPGTVLGSAVRLITMFKTFPLTVYTKIMRREMDANGATTFREWLSSEKNTNFHTTQLIAMSAIAGYLSMTIDDLLQGKKPRTFTNARGEVDKDIAIKLAQDSFLRGGAGGLMADMLMREYDNGYKNIVKQLGGPAVNEAMKLAALSSKTIHGEPSAKEYFDFLKGNIPYANLFYVKPALDHLVWFNIQNMLDPGALRRREQQNIDDYGQDYWLKPSE